MPTTVYSTHVTSHIGKAISKTRKNHVNRRCAVVSEETWGKMYSMFLSSLKLAVPLYVPDSSIRPKCVHFVVRYGQEIGLLSLALS